MFSEVDKHGNIDRKHNVSATMFPEVDKHGNIERKHNVSAAMFPEVDKHGNIDKNTMFLQQRFLVKSFVIRSPGNWLETLQLPLLVAKCSLG